MLGSHGYPVLRGLNRQCHWSSSHLSLINLICRQALGCGLVLPHLARDSEICPRGKFEVKKRLASERPAEIYLRGKAHVTGHTRACQICQWTTALDTTSAVLYLTEASSQGDGLGGGEEIVEMSL